MQAVVGGNVVYPNLQGIADLFRSGINDTSNNAGGSGTGTGMDAGIVMPNSNPDLLVFMSSAIQETFEDLRNVGDPQLILDNYILTGLPPVNSNLGVGVPNPETQVSVAYSGYFDGVQWYPNWTLPVSLRAIQAVWERLNGYNEDFQAMKPAPFGLPGAMQGTRQGLWEVRQGALWMPGATDYTDIRIRCRIDFPTSFNSSNLNFVTTYVPILTSRNAIVAKMLILYAKRFAPELYQMAVADEARLMEKLKLETVRQMQVNENQRSEFGGEAVQDFAVAWAWL